MKFVQTTIVVLAVLWIAACSSTGGSKESDVAVEEHSASSGAGDEYGAAATGVSSYGDLGIAALSDPDSPLSRRVIYFGYDSSDIAEEDRALIAAHAEFLVANPDIHVSLEGHSDERGAREYNIGLAERRAQSVRRMLEFQGVSADQVSVVSYGEEKPAVEGYDETAWSQNRRVEIVYVGR